MGRLSGRVAVVTGASSGIGRATALRFARGGAHVALAARSHAALDEVRGAIEALGGRALAVECDVADEDAVEALAARAEEALGPIAVWVNDAGVYAMGRFEETPPEVFRRVLETNFMGTVNGSRAALRRFRGRGEGVLVNVASVDARVAAPYASAYAASKHAVLGFSAALRQELRLDRARGVHVCVVLPSSVDTPLFQHAANFTGAQIVALPPVIPPERVARVIEALVESPRREVLVGGAARAMSAGWTLAPAIAERVLAWMVHRTHFRRGRAAPDTPGNVFGPIGPEAETGGWERRADGGARRAAVVGGAVALAAGALWLRARTA